MSEFKDRPRFTLEEAQKIVGQGNWIAHIMNNQDGTYSVMGHIVCEHCDYCDLENEWWDKQKKDGLNPEENWKLGQPTFPPIEDPYERQKVKCPENYGMDTIGNVVEWDEINRYWKAVIPNTISLNEFRESLEKRGYNIVSSYDVLFCEYE